MWIGPLPLRAQRVHEQTLEVGDQPLGLRHQRALRDHARAHAHLDPLDEHAILGADLVVELEVVGDPLLVRVRRRCISR